MAQDGYGVSYIISSESSVFFHISCRKDSEKTVCCRVLGTPLTPTTLSRMEFALPTTLLMLCEKCVRLSMRHGPKTNQDGSFSTSSLVITLKPFQINTMAPPNIYRFNVEYFPKIIQDGIDHPLYRVVGFKSYSIDV